MGPIRILQVLGGLNIGGAETFVMNIYRNIDRDKVQFDFVKHTEDKCDFDDEIRSLGGKIYSCPRYRGTNHFDYCKWWKNFFNTHKEYKIIHSHIRSTASIILKIAHKYGLITIAHSHSTSNGKGIASFVKKVLQFRIRYVADYLFACSKESAIWLYGKKYAESDKCFIINNAIDTKNFIYNSKIRDKIKHELNISDDTLIIGQVGRLESVKNHDFSLAIMKKMKNKGIKFKFIIIGDGSLKKHISNLINQYDLSKDVIMLGNRSNVNELLQVIDVYLMPSLYEGLSLSLVEAQASSCGCIISNTITAGILINDIVKSISLEDNLDNWINAILSFKNNIKIDRYSQIVKSGFDIFENANKIENFYLNFKKGCGKR